MGKNKKDFKVTEDMFKSVLNSVLKNSEQRKMLAKCFGSNKQCQLKK